MPDSVYVTKNRELIKKILIKEARPLLVKEIKDKIAASGNKINESTIYRNLELYVAQKKVKKILLLERKARFEWSSRHHHHFKCLECGNIYEIDCDLSDIEVEVGQRTGHRIVGHNLGLFGICKNCLASEVPQPKKQM